jgi:uncharacterized protein (DUF1800 family)
MIPTRKDTAAAIAANRFGLGARPGELSAVERDPQDWLARQLKGTPPVLAGQGLRPSSETLAKVLELRKQVAEERRARKSDSSSDDEARVATALKLPAVYRPVYIDEVHARFAHSVSTERPFLERLTQFWTNHFAVSIDKIAVLGLAGAMEREAIRPRVTGHFTDLLLAVEKHPAMILYLDNQASIGPNSRAAQFVGRRGNGRKAGINENLAREILELHTLGVADGGGVYGPWGGYTQADVTSFAKLLTGWRAEEGEKGADPVQFEGPRHEPGSKTVMGKTYPEGPKALDAILHDLAAHPNTARHVSAKLARHFVADQPPKALVDRLVATYQKTDGDLAAMYRTLIDAPESWDAAAGKLKTPEEFGISTLRLLGMNESIFGRKEPDGAIASMGQRTHYAPSPAGWPDMAEEWLGPEAMWKRVEWAMRVAKEMPPNAVDARALARESLGPRLSDTTAKQIERAADGQQAVVLLLLSPEFQRR